MRKRSIVTAVAASALLLGTVGSASSASAAPNDIYGGCDPDSVCLWIDANAQGGEWTAGPAAGVYVWNLTDNGFNDVMTSWANNSSTEMCWYVDAGYQGGKHYMAPYHGVQNVKASENDQASSLQVAPHPRTHGYYSNDDC